MQQEQQQQYQSPYLGSLEQRFREEGGVCGAEMESRGGGRNWIARFAVSLA